MPKHINSAYRVYEILKVACNITGNQPICSVFADVFGIPTDDARARILEATRLMGLFYAEVEDAHKRMKATDFSEDLYDNAFQAINSYMAITLIFNPWEGQRHQICNVIHLLKFCSEVLPNEEQLVDSETLDQLGQLLNELNEKLKSTELPDYVRAFVVQQVAIIEKAIREYKIVGAKAFKSAVYEGAIHYMEHEEEVSEHTEKEEFSLLGRAWNKVKNVASYGMKAEKYLSAGVKLFELGSGAADHIDKIV